jgi:hypothetical protein
MTMNQVAGGGRGLAQYRVPEVNLQVKDMEMSDSSGKVQ